MQITNQEIDGTGVPLEEVEYEYLEETQSDGIPELSMENPSLEESDVTTSTELNSSSSNQLKLPTLGSVMRDLFSTIFMTLTYPFSYLLRLLSGKK